MAEHFFIIAPETLSQISTKLYGYCLINGQVILDAEQLAGRQPTPDGAYVYVQQTATEIIVRQDFIGCYGLYLYQDGDYWALSNSFLYLLEYVKKQHPISFNREYADCLIGNAVPGSGGLCSIAVTETIINEIRCLDRAAVVHINLANKSHSTSLQDYNEYSLTLDSVQGMAVLDDWANKWIDFIRSLQQQNNNISVDLSGGFDSRMVFGLFLSSGIDLNQICVNSTNDGLHTHNEDFAIASEIARLYHFPLNHRECLRNHAIKYSLADTLNISFYSKLTLHMEMYWKRHYNQQLHYSFTGGGGESVRGRWIEGQEAFLATYIKDKTRVDSTLSLSNYAVVQRSFAALRQKYRALGKELPEKYINNELYMAVISRYHFGRAMVESFFSGVITLAVLLDSNLHRLQLSTHDCPDNNLLMAVMHDRYNPALLGIRVNGGRSIDAVTIRYAHQLNQKYPRRHRSFVPRAATTRGHQLTAPAQANPAISVAQIREYIKTAFFAPEVASTFKMLYQERTFNKLAENWVKASYFPDRNAYLVLPISKIYADCLANQWMRSSESVASYMLRQIAAGQTTGVTAVPLRASSVISAYVTARLDIKNRRTTTKNTGKAANTEAAVLNDLEFQSISDPYAILSTPSWFNQRPEGRGYLLQSEAGQLQLQLRCIGAGLMRIELKALDLRTAADPTVRVPYWLDYTRLEVNGKVIFDQIQCAWHDRPYLFEQPVTDGEELSIIVQWQPHDERQQRCLPYA